MSEHGRLQINLLGKPEVWLNGERLTGFATTKTEALLYYLALTRQLHRREMLADLLWPTMPEPQARRNLTKSLTVLRRLLEPFLVIEPQRIGFDPAQSIDLDVAHFATADLSSPDAIAHYRGDFLDGFFVKNAAPFEDWQLRQREQYRATAVATLERLVEQAADRHAYDVGTTYARRLLELDPWRESAHRSLMLFLARQGQPAAALAQYEQCRRLLAEELGVEPMPETTRLFQRLQRVRQGRLDQLPADATPFIGRQEELVAIGRRLSDPGCRLLTLIGLGGMGKTRLALAAARQANQAAAWRFLDGVLFIPLAAVADPDLLTVAIADALALSLTGQSEPLSQLTHFLRDKEMLLVLDNFEHLLAGTNVLHHLLQACPDLKLLVTSREALHTPAEHRFEVGGLPFPPDSLPDPLPPADYPAVQLFVQAARQVRPDFQLTDETADAIAHICRTLAGMPLAVKLAASWVRLLTVAEIAAEIERGLALLATTMRDVPPRQRSLAAVFDHTWHMLTATEQAALDGLSVFRGGFTASAAQAVVNATLPVLAGLVDRSLLQARSGGRYFLHELTRQYAAARLAQSPATAAAVETAHRRYYARHLAELTPELSGHAPQYAYAAIHQEMDNARRAWQSSIEALDLDSLTHLLEPLTHFYYRQGWFTAGQAELAAALRALSHAGAGDRAAARLQAALLARQGLLMGRIGRFAAAESVLRQSIEQARRLADPHLLAVDLLELGRLLRDQSRFAAAAEAFAECYDIAAELDDQHLLARALEKLGVVTWDQGSHKAAQRQLAEALQRFRELQDTRRIANTLNALGNVVMSMGDNRAALAHYQAALPIVRELEDWLLLDTLLINLGMATHGLGEYEQARRYYEESEAICRRIGDEIGVAYCLTGIGMAHMAVGEDAQARPLIAQSLAMNQEMARERYVAINLNLLGELALKQADRPAARAAFTESLAISQRIGHPWGVASGHLHLGDLAVAEGDETAAAYHYLEALRLGQEIEAEGMVMTALTNLAARLLGRGEVVTAAAVLQIVQQQPAITPSLAQRTADLLAQAAVARSDRATSPAETTLAAAVATIQRAFAADPLEEWTRTNADRTDRDG